MDKNIVKLVDLWYEAFCDGYDNMCPTDLCDSLEDLKTAITDAEKSAFFAEGSLRGLSNATRWFEGE